MNMVGGGGCHVISLKEVMKFKTIELILELPDFLSVTWLMTSSESPQM
jgi:hypothetical protein